MQNDVNKTQLFYDYYQQWIEVYKRGAIRDAIYCQCGTKIRACKYDNHAENIFTYYSGVGK